MTPTVHPSLTHSFWPQNMTCSTIYFGKAVKVVRFDSPPNNVLEIGAHTVKAIK